MRLPSHINFTQEALKANFTQNNGKMLTCLAWPERQANDYQKQTFKSQNAALTLHYQISLLSPKAQSVPKRFLKLFQ